MPNYVPTGFPELDNRLNGGLVKPSCVGICGEHATQIYPFLFNLTQNFLKAGLRGLYVCLDSSAEDVKFHMKSLGINLEHYESDYSIFYLDFFTESQKALMEQAKIGILEYDPEEAFKAIAQFLDWIKEGFLIIDSISTLTLNMDPRKAYELTRALKLLTRPFNLITLGVMYPSSLDPKVFSALCSNADGQFIIDKETLRIGHILGVPVNGEIFLITKDQHGKIYLKPALPREISRDMMLEVLNIFAKTNSVSVNPLLTLEMPWSNADAQDLIFTMEKLREADVLSSKAHCSSLSCPYCGSYRAHFHLKCPQCESLLFDKGEAIEHFNCGHIDFQRNFERDGELECPKCRKKLRLVGVDYRKIHSLYKCSNGHIFSSPMIRFTCTKCHRSFSLEEAHMTPQHTYELTEHGRDQLQKIKAQRSYA
ncbi:MAG: ATPase domain-containing protein [Candidatus Bathyarchaeia archaeon]